VKQLIGILTAVKSSSYFTPDTLNQCPLLGVKRTSFEGASMSPFDPFEVEHPNLL
jgi:hypothetical protein